MAVCHLFYQLCLNPGRAESSSPTVADLLDEYGIGHSRAAPCGASTMG